MRPTSAPSCVSTAAAAASLLQRTSALGCSARAAGFCCACGCTCAGGFDCGATPAGGGFEICAWTASGTNAARVSAPSLKRVVLDMIVSPASTSCTGPLGRQKDRQGVDLRHNANL